MPTPNDILAASQWNTGYANNTGNMSYQEFLNTPEGRQYVSNLANQYRQRAQSGQAGYGLPTGVTGWDDGSLETVIAQTLLEPGQNQQLSNWINGASGVAAPDMRSASQRNFQSNQDLTRKMADDANQLSRDLAAMQDQTARDLAAMNDKLQRDLQAGLITHQEAMAASQQAHEKAMQQEQLAFQYAELAWTKEYGQQNLAILRDRLQLDRETSEWQKANDERRVAVEEGGLALNREKFGLEKNIQEAMLRANPYNAVANALYSRGANVPGGQTEYGQYTTTLDNSGTLPFLQQLQQNGQIDPTSMPGGGMYMNQGGIGGNAAPNPNQISQASMGNMNAAERGITTSLAQYGGWDPNDYWQKVQNSWNTAGQQSQRFGGTRLA